VPNHITHLFSSEGLTAVSFHLTCDYLVDVCGSEVQKTTETAKALYHRWSELVDDQRSSNKEEFDWTTNELRNSLRSIEWDLEDLEETINIF